MREFVRVGYKGAELRRLNRVRRSSTLARPTQELYCSYVQIEMTETPDAKDALQRIKGTFYQLVYSYMSSLN
jgi:hypothetical protein